MNEEKQAIENEQEMIEEPTATPDINEDDLFNQVFGDNSDEFVAKDESEISEPALDQASEVQSPIDPKDDPEQFQYWQSQSDKRQVEIDVLKEQMANMMNQVSQKKPEESVEEEPVKLERPIKPRKPSDYDHTDALSDPDSESAKYLTKKDEYMDDLSEYMLSLETQRSEQVAKQQAEQKELMQKQQLRNDLQANYNYSNEQAEDFINTMSSPESLSLDNLVRLHQLNLTSVTQEVQQVSPQAQMRQNTMVKRQEKLAIPKPIGIQPGADMQSSKKSAEDQMMDSMVSNFRKKNPF
tara:strand:- start:1978 stop:2865 length:888 start_codon:yes stop_codon:yes gene_type:complete